MFVWRSFTTELKLLMTSILFFLKTYEETEEIGTVLWVKKKKKVFRTQTSISTHTISSVINIAIKFLFGGV